MDQAVPSSRSGPAFTERWPEVVSPVPPGGEDPLGASVLDGAPLRVFAPADVRLVLGRGQNPWRELVVAQAQADGVPIHRRPTGGGAVILAPGCVVIACRLPAWDGDTVTCCGRINACLIPALRAVGAPELMTCGHGDLTVRADGGPRKILGASLRRGAFGVLYLGALLIDDISELMGRYLLAPSRQPDYRQGREHRRFCSHLGCYGITEDTVIPAIEGAMRSVLSE